MSVLPADAYDGRRVLVTGGAGFIGSHLTDALVERGADVCVLDDLSQGLESNLESVRDRIDFVHGSLLDDEAVRKALDGAEVVFHEAAVTSVPASIERPAIYHEVNGTGLVRLLEGVRTMGVQRFVFAASSSAYGDQLESPKVETMCPDPLSPYAVTKCMGEQMIRAYSLCYGIKGVSLRYFNIFGPRQRPDSPYAAVIPKFADAYLGGRTPIIFGDGEQTRDFTFVANAVHANLLAGCADAPLCGEAVNVACGAAITVNELLRMVAEGLGVEAAADYQPERVGEVKHSCADVSAARALIGYEPVISLEEGLAQTLEWYKADVVARSG